MLPALALAVALISQPIPPVPLEIVAVRASIVPMPAGPVLPWGCTDPDDQMACATRLAAAIGGSGGGVSAAAFGSWVYFAPAAPAGDITPTPEDAPGLVAELIKAIKEKNWPLFAAMLALLIVMAANALILRFGILADDMRKEVLPWLAAGTGMLTSFAGTLLAGGGWWTATSTGLLIGTSAIGLWELVGKRVKKWLAKRAAAKKEVTP